MHPTRMRVDATRQNLNVRQSMFADLGNTHANWKMGDVMFICSSAYHTTPCNHS